LSVRPCGVRSLGGSFYIMADRNPLALLTLCPLDWISVCGHRETESCSELTGYCVVRSRRRPVLTLAAAEAEETSFLEV